MGEGGAQGGGHILRKVVGVGFCGESRWGQLGPGVGAQQCPQGQSCYSRRQMASVPLQTPSSWHSRSADPVSTRLEEQRYLTLSPRPKREPVRTAPTEMPGLGQWLAARNKDGGEQGLASSASGLRTRLAHPLLLGASSSGNPQSLCGSLGLSLGRHHTCASQGCRWKNLK